MDREPWWKTIVNVAMRTFTSTVVFTLVALPTAYLFALVRFIERAGTSNFVVYVLTYLEYAFVIADAVFITWWIIFDVWEVMKEKLQ